MSKTFNHPSIINNNHGNITADCSLSALKQLKKQKREREKNIEYTKMAMRMWASSTANALKISVASKTSLSLPRCFSSVVDGLKYATSHEWVKHEGPVATIGITDHAQDHLGEVVFVELPEVGASFKKGEPFGAVESVKATSDINSPVSGEVVEVNSALTEAPGAINKEPYTGGWLIKVKPSTPAELDALLGAKEYTKFCEEEDAAH